ncbi:streptomycin 6-kinase [Friedmanniella endophytica]|uniref:Streptomycin 6-kinase n=1 Tax=Microlunatus kandeliicorticis TaxID=1759536 RepID=A0A7W3IUI5_9ACTN|nr:aminoglycoside phosphotransferase family protein [Microlunatus kandeliicorticis]MBA8795444.1 streptomycin 6-kinase [Microlunatus kandeliicorticis]
MTGAAAVPMPANLRASAERTRSAGMRAWYAGLPDRIADLAQRWELELGAPFEPGGSGSWVAPATDAGGADLVLKVGWTHTEARDEAEGLAVLGGEGAVQVFRYENHGPTTAALLERCRPGEELRTRPEGEQHRVIGALLRRIRAVPVPADHPFRPLTELCDLWADEAETAHAERPPGVDPGLVREGLALFRALPRDADTAVLLCTDLHGGNVLSGTRLPWLLIDPKPYVGDPHYDVLQHLLNCFDSLLADPLGLIARVCDEADLDPTRVRHWLFARCIQDSPDWPDLAALARALAA